jgi:hypothetical protein
VSVEERGAARSADEPGDAPSADEPVGEETATPAPAEPGELDRLIAELGAAAERLRSGEADDEEAAALVERCAELAAEAGAALDREARAARAQPPPGQETLL